ncbi:MAG: ATP-grasp domain-containing protein, partial [Coriobacteriales bacterium]|nr:ATP-grasp domain-containing protein [Coriobacteriales bacterium]
EFMDEAIRVTPEHPVYLDRFLEDAVELDLDCLCDGHEVYIGGILEHIEMAGIHSGDSACCIPPFTLSLRLQRRLRDIATQLALQLQVRGLLNVQFAVKGQQVYVLEANPRASRTVPFISKATGVALARIAALLMCGQHLCDLQLPPDDREPRHFCVKEAVLPFGRFPGASAVLGPEMKSTGEVMGIARSFPQAYIKTQIAVGYELARDGIVLIAVRDEDKRSIGQIACALADLGFKLAATPGTARTLRALGLEVAQVAPLGSGAGSEPGIEALIDSGELKLIVNTPSGENGHDHGFLLRTAAVQHGITYITTMAAAQAFTVGLESSRASIGLPVIALQDL